jgi:hypothetical protein
LLIPNGLLTVGIDGGYVRPQHKQGWFEVIAGKSLLAFTRGEASDEMDLDAAVASSGHATDRKLLKALEEFHTYIEHNGGFIPNYGERYCYGQRISTGFLESNVNQAISKRFCKRQQMEGTPRGAHLLLLIRTCVSNGDWETTFLEWYLGFRSAPQQVAA